MLLGATYETNGWQFAKLQIMALAGAVATSRLPALRKSANRLSWVRVIGQNVGVL